MTEFALVVFQYQSYTIIKFIQFSTYVKVFVKTLLKSYFSTSTLKKKRTFFALLNFAFSFDLLLFCFNLILFCFCFALI